VREPSIDAVLLFLNADPSNQILVIKPINTGDHMKFFGIAILSLVASFALAYDDSVVVWPSVNGLMINNACATDTTFRSLHPVSTCMQTEKTRYAVSDRGEIGEVRRELRAGDSLRSGETLVTETRCVSYDRQDMEVSRNVETSECAEIPRSGEITHTCRRFVRRTVMSPRTFSVEKVIHHGDLDHSTWFQFTVPNCQ